MRQLRPFKNGSKVSSIKDPIYFQASISQRITQHLAKKSKNFTTLFPKLKGLCQNSAHAEAKRKQRLSSMSKLTSCGAKTIRFLKFLNDNLKVG